jgi:hypothetical protein
MPLYSGVSKKIISKNISELTSGPAGTARSKAIHTMMKKGMSYDQAKNRQAVAIAMSKAGKSKK